MAPSHNNKMWKKRYLVPLWVVQLIVLGMYFVLSIVGISAAQDLDDNDRFEYADQDVYVFSITPPQQSSQISFTMDDIKSTDDESFTGHSSAQSLAL